MFVLGLQSVSSQLSWFWNSLDPLLLCARLRGRQKLFSSWVFTSLWSWRQSCSVNTKISFFKGTICQSVLLPHPHLVRQVDVGMGMRAYMTLLLTVVFNFSWYGLSLSSLDIHSYTSPQDGEKSGTETLMLTSTLKQEQSEEDRERKRQRSKRRRYKCFV